MLENIIHANPTCHSIGFCSSALAEVLGQTEMKFSYLVLLTKDFWIVAHDLTRGLTKQQAMVWAQVSSNRFLILLLSVHPLPPVKLGLKLCSVQRYLLVLKMERLKTIAPVAEKRPPNHQWEWWWSYPVNLPWSHV